MFTYPFSFLGGGNLTQEAATLLLNGVDQYVRLDDSRVYTASGSGTVSAWVNLASLSTDDGKMAFISKRENTFSRSWQLGYRESGNLFEFTVYHSSGETSVVSQLSPVIGDWYHVAGVFDDTNVKLYVDGTQVATATLGGAYNVSEALAYIGVAGQFTSNNLYNGSIAIPLVFNVAKTDAEVLDLATARNPDNYSQVGMQVGIPLNTSVLTPEENTISSNGDATLFGSPTYTGELLPLGTIPQVTGFSTLNLNGTTEYAEITHSSSLNLSSEMTLSIWVNLDSLGTSGSDNLFNKISSTTGYRLEYDKFFKKFGIVFYSGGVLKRVQTTTTPVTGAWYHVAATYDGTTIKIYLNGVEENSSAFTGSIDTNTQNVTINATGSVALATIFDSALSSTRISELSIAKDPSLYTQTDLVMGLPLNVGSSSPNDDITSNGNDATLQGGAAIDGKVLSIEQASGPAEADYNTFGFDATAKSVTVNDISIGTTYSFSLWFNPTLITGFPNIYDLNYLEYSNPNYGPRLEAQYDGDLFLNWSADTGNSLNFNSIQLSTGGIVANTWYNIIFTCNSGTFTAYLNGVNVGSSTSTYGYPQAFNAFTLGKGYLASREFEGSITSPLLWNRALTSGEVSNLYQSGKTPYYETLPSSLTSGCVMALELSSRDNTLNDLSGNGNNGTANGGVTDDGDLQTFTPYEEPASTPDQLQGLQLWVEGDTGYSDKSSNTYTVTNNGSTNTDTLNGLNVFSFNGSSQYIDIGTQLGKPSNFTVIAVINANSVGRAFIAGSISSSGSATTVWGNFFLTQPNKPTGSLECYNSSDTDYSTSYTTDNLLSASTWYVIAQRYTAGNNFIDIWVDGVQATIVQNSFGDSNEGTIYDYAIGRGGEFTSLYFNGKISEYIVSDAAESTQDILGLTSSLQSKYAL